MEKTFLQAACMCERFFLHSLPASDADPHTESEFQGNSYVMSFYVADEHYCCRIPTQVLTHIYPSGVSVQHKWNNNNKKKQGIPFWLWWLYLHGGDSDTRMTNVARLHLAPWQRAVQTFMMQHFKYFLFMTKFLLMSEGHKRKHQSSLAAMIDFFTLTCINRNHLQASYINHASNALSPLAHSSLGRTDYAGCVYIFISVPLLMWIMC